MPVLRSASALASVSVMATGAERASRMTKSFPSPCILSNRVAMRGDLGTGAESGNLGTKLAELRFQWETSAMKALLFAALALTPSVGLACSVTSGFRVSTNIELIQEADLVVLARVEGGPKQWEEVPGAV